MRHHHGHSLLFILLLLPLIMLAVFGVTSKEKQAIKTQAQSTQPTTPAAPTATVIAKNLSIPWAIAFLPDFTMLVTERAGKVKLVSQNGLVEEVGTITGVQHSGEGGLLGIALHPEFPINKYVYVYYTYAGTGTGTLNRVARYTYENKQLASPTTILDAIPGAANHNGGRIKFGPDGMLYIATGDAQTTSNAQDTSSLAGKILRVTDAGLAAPGNPFNNRTYTYGHRNPQGFDWNGTTLYATEHGNSSPSCCDEVNLIEPGKNYGWPTIEGDAQQAGMVNPLVHSGSDSSTTWAPSGTAFFNGSVFFGGLKGQALYEAKVQGSTAGSVAEHFKGEYGRIREVIVGPDNQLYFATSNHDGRGTPKAEDDKIVKVSFSATASPAPSTPATTPTFGVIAPCPSCDSPSESPVVTSGVLPSGGAANPTTVINNPDPEDPCDAEGASLAHNKKKKSKHKNHDGGISNFAEQILRFLIELITLILRLFGTGPVNPVPTPDPSIPGDPCDPSSVPTPTTLPVPTVAPQSTTAPQPTTPPAAPTSSNNPPQFTPVTIAPQPTSSGFTPNRPDPVACTPSGQACNPNRPCCGGACRPAINTPGDPGICD